MTPELLATVACHYDELEIRPIYSSSSIVVKAFNLLTQRDENHVISFLDMALAISPDHGGKIDAGYFTHGYDADSGPYKEWNEVAMEPMEFFAEVYESGETEYRIDTHLKAKYKEDVNLGVHKILTKRLSKRS